MKRRSLTITAAVIAFALPLAASAVTPGENFLTNWDLDEDGKVTLEEVLERRGDLFSSFDADEDGSLSAAEMADHDAMREAMQAAQERPANAGRGAGQGQRGQGGGQGGGRMMPAQPGWGGPQGWGPQQGWAAPQGWGPGWTAPQGWGQMPRRGGPQGWAQQPGYGLQGPMMQGYGPQGPAMRGPGPQGWGGAQGAPTGNTQDMHAQMEAAMDGDKDGLISKAEFLASGEDWFTRFDRDQDGAITADDFGSGRR